MTMVKVKLKLAQLNAGDHLDVILTAGEPLENVPRTVEEQGSKVLSVSREGEHYRVLIEK
jgi:tRNA 2-thiouridine synthesizing protein A